MKPGASYYRDVSEKRTKYQHFAWSADHKALWSEQKVTDHILKFFHSANKSDVSYV